MYFKLKVQSAYVCICSNIVLCVCVCFMHTRCARVRASYISDHVSDVLFCMFAHTYIYNLPWSCLVFPPVPRTKGLGLTFTSAHVLIRALVDGPGSQPTDTMDHIKCVVRALVPILAVSLPHVCVIAERLDCRHRLALAARYGHSTGDPRTKRTVHNKLDFNTGDQCPFDTVVLGECHNAYLAPRPATMS